MEQARLRADRLHTGRGWADQHEQGEGLALADHMTSSIIAIGLPKIGLLPTTTAFKPSTLIL